VLLAAPAQESVTSPSPATAFTVVGFHGTRNGVALASFDACPGPCAFTPRTWKVYSTQFVSPLSM
jgi:hypothetical protein